MKKQFFLLSLLLAAANFMDASCNSCNTTCSSGCSSGCSSDCSSGCSSGCSSSCGSCDDNMRSHGHVFLSIAPEWGAATPERVSLFANQRLNDLKKDDKHGRFQLAVFGGQSTKGSQTASYFLPYGHKTLTFNGAVNTGVYASDLAETDAQLVEYGDSRPAIGDELSVGGDYGYNGNTTIAVDPATYKFDLNKDTSKILPWNFGITYAALFEPRGASAEGAIVGTGLISNPAFQSTICPVYKRWHVGVGLELYYHFSDDVDKGWYGRISTAVEHVNSKIKLNENVITDKTLLDQTFFDDNKPNPSGSQEEKNLV